MRGVELNGEAIRRLRLSAGFTQEQLGVEADCDPKTIGKVERSQGRVDLRIAVGIAEALGAATEEILAPTASSSLVDTHIQIVREWNDAIVAWNIDNLISFHTEDSLLEILGAPGLPGAGCYQGVDQLREHFEETSQWLRIASYDAENLQISAVDNLAFMRSDATIEHIPSGKTYTTRHVNEFEFRDRKISRRTVIADYDGLRQILSDAS